jgi:tetratricopeptide (TPR) repeat protein
LVTGCGPSPQKAYEQGMALYEHGNLYKAYPLLKKAAKGGISTPQLALCLAYCHVSIDNDPTGAIDLLRDSALNFPDFAPTYYQLGLISYNFGPAEDGGNLVQAIYFARKAVELSPDEWLFADNLATYYYLAGEQDSALYYFKQASELNPFNKELAERVKKVEEALSKSDSLNILTSD